MQTKPSFPQRLRRQFRRLAKSQAGVTTLEYIVIAVLILAVTVTACLAMSKTLRDRVVQIIHLIAGNPDDAVNITPATTAPIDTMKTQSTTIQGGGASE